MNSEGNLITIKACIKMSDIFLLAQRVYCAVSGSYDAHIKIAFLENRAGLPLSDHGDQQVAELGTECHRAQKPEAYRSLDCTLTRYWESCGLYRGGGISVMGHSIMI